MHPYLIHLLADIKAAHCTDTLPEMNTPQSFEEEMEQRERFVLGEMADHTFGHYCGLKTEQFPPVEQLTIDEMRLVCKTFEEMMRSWNLDATYPDNLPIDRVYTLLVNTLNEGTMIVSPMSGSVSFDYCSGNAPDCIFKEYCSCLKYWESDEAKK